MIKLVEYQQAQREGVRPAGIGAGGVLLLVFLIVFGMSATSGFPLESGMRSATTSIWAMTISPFSDTTTAYDDQLQQDFPAGSSLRIVNDRGAVNLTVSDDNQIHVVGAQADQRRQPGRSRQDSIPAPSRKSTSAANVITLNANTQGAGDHSVTTDLDVSVPRKVAVVISSRRGDVSVLGRDGDVEIASQHGDVAASDINGKVTLNLTGGSARVSNVSGDVSVQGRADDVSLADVKGARPPERRIRHHQAGENCRRSQLQIRPHRHGVFQT